ncbi:hypothetical protein KUTeg_008016 [Tegillarca granosa]|uniref:Anoctamin n=1 Tax=Tegillarca granosa TaxID=220873 RepID=A0ABQ9FI69_TEGGR|nr:hypothetical protein KUTeg_008016 [Tegillarca granosa]
MFINFTDFMESNSCFVFLTCYRFVIENKDGFFTKAQRSRMVHEVLSRAAFDDEKGKMKFGINKLVKSGTYSAAYPLHDGRFHSEHSILTRGKSNDRHLLYEVWAKPGAWYKYQPLDQIRNYFGEKIGIYFAWLGFYTMMLIPAAIIGVIAFLYGLGTFMDDIARKPSDQSLKHKLEEERKIQSQKYENNHVS